jgi:hypothetical protein
MSPLARGVDRNWKPTTRRRTPPSRPPCEGVDRNMSELRMRTILSGRPSLGGVDRNQPWCTRAMTISRPSYAGAAKASAGRVALRARAWIETASGWPTPMVARVALRARARIETSPTLLQQGYTPCRPPCEGVDRNMYERMIMGDYASRPLCGGVDRNQPWCTRAMTTKSPARERIETRPTKAVKIFRERRPLCGGVDRNAIITS